MDDFDNLLTGLNRLDDLFANGFDFNLFNEVFDNRQRHVSLKQGDADFAHSGIYILLRKRAAPRKVVKYTA